MEVLAGTAGWSYEDWVGPFYPERPRLPFSRLTFYSGFFDCVEVDSTFYRHFAPSVAEKWIAEVEGNRNFVFLMKLHKSFTHGGNGKPADLAGDERAVTEFIRPFVDRGKLGGMLVQFSEYFKDTPLSRDRITFVAEKFANVTLFFELRNTSWYNGRAREFLAERGVNLIAIDQPLLKGMVDLTPDIVGRDGYFRLHGRNEEMWKLGRQALAARGMSEQNRESDDADRNARYNYLYSGRELDEIEGKIRKVGERCERTYVVANNHPMGKAVANALELVKRLRNQERVKMPDTVTRYFPELEKFADKVSTGPSDMLF